MLEQSQEAALLASNANLSVADDPVRSKSVTVSPNKGNIKESELPPINGNQGVF